MIINWLVNILEDKIAINANKLILSSVSSIYSNSVETCFHIKKSYQTQTSLLLTMHCGLHMFS